MEASDTPNIMIGQNEMGSRIMSVKIVSNVNTQEEPHRRSFCGLL